MALENRGAACLRKWRGDKRLTQRELADRISDVDPTSKVTPHWISRWENGHVRPGLRSAIAIRAATGGIVTEEMWRQPIEESEAVAS